MAISLTYTFTPGTRILSSQVNSNFSTLATRALDKTGDTMTGNLLFTDDTYDIGASGATRPRRLYLSKGITVAGVGIIGDTGKIPAISSTYFTDLSGSNLTGINAKPYLLWTASAAVQPVTSFATFDTRNTHPVLEFDAASEERTWFHGVMPTSYAGGSVAVDIYWCADTATSGDVQWAVAWERVTGQDIDADSLAGALTAVGTANGTAGILTKTTITFLSSEIDSVVASDAFRIRVARDAGSVNDTMTGDAQLLRVAMREV